MEWLFGKKKTPAGELPSLEISPRACALPPSGWLLSSVCLVGEGQIAQANPLGPIPAELLRENKRMLDRAIRELDRERMGLQTQEKKLIMEIKKMAKDGQMVGASVPPPSRLLPLPPPPRSAACKPTAALIPALPSAACRRRSR
jgi:hypothetical protein